MEYRLKTATDYLIYRGVVVLLVGPPIRVLVVVGILITTTQRKRVTAVLFAVFFVFHAIKLLIGTTLQLVSVLLQII